MTVIRISKIIQQVLNLIQVKYFSLLHVIYIITNQLSVYADASDKLNVLIHQILNNREKPFDLVCPQRADSQPCGSILRLANKLLIHNEWLKLSHNTHISMIQMDIALSFIPENIFTNIFI
eukprot:9247_1